MARIIEPNEVIESANRLIKARLAGSAAELEAAEMAYTALLKEIDEGGKVEI